MEAIVTESASVQSRIMRGASGRCANSLPSEDNGVQIGTLAGIWRYPVKSLAAETLTNANISYHGVEGDRLSALFAGAGHARAGKTYEGIHDDRLHVWRRAGDAIADAGARGVTLAERSGEGPYHYSLPISLIFDRWIAEVEAVVGEALDPRRWRPNLLVRASGGFQKCERDLIGETLHVGAAALRVVKPIKRCMVPTYDLDGGASTPEIQTYVVRERANVMGVYCEVVAEGPVSVGDLLSV